MRHADHGVQAAPVDGEPGQAGGPGGVGDVLGRRLHVQRRHLHARCHHVLRGQFGEVQGADEQLGRVRLQRTLLRRVPGQRHQLLRAAGGGQLLGRLQTEAAHDPVGRVVEVADEGPEHGGEHPLRGGHRLGHGQRGGDRPVLRDQLADDHQDHRRQRRADDEGQGGGRGGRQPGRFDGAADQLGDGRFGEHADHQVGDGDAELGPRELEGEAPDGLEGARSAPVALFDGPFELAALHGRERELGRDEGAAGEAEQQGDEQQKDFDHRFTSVP